MTISYKKIYIKEKAKFYDLLLLVEKQKHIALDTEFMRVNSFWPQLSLIQIAFDGQAYIIDATAIHDYIADLKPILLNPNILKICHSGYQDIEVLFHMTNAIMTPYFDTQIAMNFLGSEHQISYEDMVHNYLNIHLQKAPSYAKWLQRPLSEDQKNYAYNDVIYLNEIYPIIKRELEKIERLSWVEEESKDLAFAFKEDLSGDKKWEKFSRSFSNAKSIEIAKTLFYWREDLARQKNLPRNRILPNKLISQIAIQKAVTSQHILSIFKQEKEKIKKTFLDEITHRLGHIDFDHIDSLAPSVPLWVRETDETIKKQVNLIKKIRDQISRKLNIIPHIIIPKAYITYISVLLDEKQFEQINNLPLFQGWRKEIVLKELQKYFNCN